MAENTTSDNSEHVSNETINAMGKTIVIHTTAHVKHVRRTTNKKGQVHQPTLFYYRRFMTSRIIARALSPLMSILPVSDPRVTAR